MWFEKTRKIVELESKLDHSRRDLAQAKERTLFLEKQVEDLPQIRIALDKAKVELQQAKRDQTEADLCLVSIKIIMNLINGKKIDDLGPLIQQQQSYLSAQRALGMPAPAMVGAGAAANNISGGFGSLFGGLNGLR